MFKSYCEFPICLLVGFVVFAGCSPGPPNAAADADQEFTTTSSGLRYRILRHSDGETPKLSNNVKVQYHGTLDSGRVFDSTYGRGKSAYFSLREVVPGFQEGLQLIGEGGMIELEIPPELGYGESGSMPAVPPNATLHFVVELERIFE